jgi:hypothetical protein
MKTPQNTSKRVWSVREAGFGPFRPDETGRNPSGWGGRKTRATPRVSAWRREGDVGEREEDDAGRRSKTTPPPKLPPRSKTTPPTLPPLRYLLSPLDLTAPNLAPIANPSQICRDGGRRGASHASSGQLGWHPVLCASVVVRTDHRRRSGKKNAVVPENRSQVGSSTRT